MCLEENVWIHFTQSSKVLSTDTQSEQHIESVQCSGQQLKSKWAKVPGRVHMLYPSTPPSAPAYRIDSTFKGIQWWTMHLSHPFPLGYTGLCIWAKQFLKGSLSKKGFSDCRLVLKCNQPCQPECDMCMIEIAFKEKFMGDRAHAVLSLEIVRKLGQGECTITWLHLKGKWLQGAGL